VEIIFYRNEIDYIFSPLNVTNLRSLWKGDHTTIG